MKQIIVGLLVVLGLSASLASCTSTPERRDDSSSGKRTVTKLDAVEMSLELPPGTELVIRMHPKEFEAARLEIESHTRSFRESGLPIGEVSTSRLLGVLLADYPDQWRSATGTDEERHRIQLDGFDNERHVVWALSARDERRFADRWRLGLPMTRASHLPGALLARLFLPALQPAEMQRQLRGICSAEDRDRCGGVVGIEARNDWVVVDLLYHRDQLDSDAREQAFSKMMEGAPRADIFQRDTPALRAFLSSNVAVGAYAKTYGLTQLDGLRAGMLASTALREVGPQMGDLVMESLRSRLQKVDELSQSESREFDDIAVVLERGSEHLQLRGVSTYTNRGKRMVDATRTQLALPSIEWPDAALSLDWTSDLEAAASVAKVPEPDTSSGGGRDTFGGPTTFWLRMTAHPFAYMNAETSVFTEALEGLSPTDLLGVRLRADLVADESTASGIQVRAAAVLSLRKDSASHKRAMALVESFGRARPKALNVDTVELEETVEMSIALNIGPDVFGEPKPVEDATVRLDLRRAAEQLRGVDSRLWSPEIRDLFEGLDRLESAVTWGQRASTWRIRLGTYSGDSLTLPASTEGPVTPLGLDACLADAADVAIAHRGGVPIGTTMERLESLQDECDAGAARNTLGWTISQWRIEAAFDRISQMRWRSAMTSLDPLCADGDLQICASLEQLMKTHTPTAIQRPLIRPNLMTLGMPAVDPVDDQGDERDLPPSRLFATSRTPSGTQFAPYAEVLSYDESSTKLRQPWLVVTREGLLTRDGRVMPIQTLQQARRGDEKALERVKSLLRVTLLDEADSRTLTTVALAPDADAPSELVAWLAAIAWKKRTPKRLIVDSLSLNEPIPRTDTAMVSLLGRSDDQQSDDPRTGMLVLSHEASAPPEEPEEHPDGPLYLNLTVARDGFSIWTPGGTLMPIRTCPQDEDGPTVCVEGGPEAMSKRFDALREAVAAGRSDKAAGIRERVLAAYDFASLYEKLVRVKQTFPRTTKIRIVVEPGVPFFVTSSVLSAVWPRLPKDDYEDNEALWRAEPTENTLFPDISLDTLER